MNFNYNVETLLTKVEGLLIKDLHNKKVYIKEVEEFNTKVGTFNKESEEEYENLVAHHQKTLQGIGDDKLIEDLTEETESFYDKGSFWGYRQVPYITRKIKSDYWGNVPYIKGLLVLPNSCGDNRHLTVLHQFKFHTHEYSYCDNRLSFTIKNVVIGLLTNDRKMYTLPFETENPDRELTDLKEKLLKLKALDVKEVSLDDKDLELICETAYSPKKCPVFEEVMGKSRSAINMSTVF